MQTFKAFALLDSNAQLFNQQVFSTKRDLIENYTGEKFGTVKYKKSWAEWKKYGYTTCHVTVTIKPIIN